MKKIALSLVVLLAAFGCETAEKLTRINFHHVFPQTIQVSVPPTGVAPLVWQDKYSINLYDNADVKKYKDHVVKVKINTFTIIISNYDGPSNGELFNASFTVGDVKIDLPNIQLKAASDNKTVINIGTSEQLEKLADYLVSHNTVELTIKGQVNTNPISFDAKITADTTITVQVIK